MIATQCNCHNFAKCSHASSSNIPSMLFTDLSMWVPAFIVIKEMIRLASEPTPNDTEKLQRMIYRFGEYDMITVLSYIFSARMYKMFLNSNYWIPTCFIFSKLQSTLDMCVP